MPAAQLNRPRGIRTGRTAAPAAGVLSQPQWHLRRLCFAKNGYTYELQTTSRSSQMLKKLSLVVLPSSWAGATSQSSEAINGLFNRLIGHPGHEASQTAETPRQS